MKIDHPNPTRKYWYKDWAFLLIFAATLGLDQLTKYLVKANLDVGESLPTDGFLRITYVTNSGSAFGFFPNQTLVLIFASFIGIAFLLFYYHAHPFPGIFLRLSLGLMLGGAIGNLIDRVQFGHVVDFIDVGPWPVFNLADSSIMVGIGIIAWIVLFSDKNEEEQSDYSTEESPTAMDTEPPE